MNDSTYSKRAVAKRAAVQPKSELDQGYARAQKLGVGIQPGAGNFADLPLGQQVGSIWKRLFPKKPK